MAAGLGFPADRRHFFQDRGRRAGRGVCYSRPIKLVETSITVAELRSMAEGRFGDLVKAVVDARRKVMAVDADLHSDEEALLLQNGSAQADLWGINL